MSSLGMKDLLGMQGLQREQISLILDTASGFKDVLKRDIKKVPALRGRAVFNLFFEPSTRTRTSFELAAKRLSTDVINFSVPTSSVVIRNSEIAETFLKPVLHIIVVPSSSMVLTVSRNLGP